MKDLIRVFICLMAMACLCGFASDAQAQGRRAVLVGVSDYGNPREEPNEWANISGANDVALLAPRLKAQGFEVGELVDAQASYANIVAALAKVAQDAREGDFVYLHFSMHGQPFEDLDGDEADGWDEALIPVDAKMRYVAGRYEGENHLLDDELDKFFNQIRSKIWPTGELVVVLDACHSGRASRGDGDHVRGTRDGFTRSGKSYSPDRAKEDNDYFRLRAGAGQAHITILEACRSYEQNREIRDRSTGMWYGPLSFYIAEAMASHRLDETDKWIATVKERLAGNSKLRRQHMVIESSK